MHALSRCLLIMFLLAMGSGCGETPSDVPPLANVTGTVTLDGQPLAGAIVLFEPQEKGAASTGATDEQGHFTLIYSATLNGAVPGTHVVRVSRQLTDMGEETLPAIYNIQSTLKETITPGDNNIVIELVSSPARKGR